MLSVSSFAQQDSIAPVKSNFNKLELRALDPLTPSKAAFYSAIVPGLGQAYNRSYWKIPLVYAGIGTSVYFYIDNQKQYNKARDEYKLRLRGINKTDTPKIGSYTADQLLVVQKRLQKNRDLSLFITLGFYVLNIVDANVDAHLQQFNVDDDLSFKPAFEYNPDYNHYQFGLNMSYKF
ncbi:MAG TPA: DUF5683 domain-containing protein [Flavobacterium sp.]|nr:DUF5683 domain-containing protein [Flavobacterium sp.]